MSNTSGFTAGTPRWVHLAFVYLERIRRPIAIALLTLVPTCVLFAAKHGYPLQEIVTNLCVMTTILPFALGGIVTRCKADGSLEFLASLPLSADEHARSWAAVAVLLSLPTVLTMTAVGYLPPFAMRGLPLMVGALSATALAISPVLVMCAVQLKASPSRAGVYFLTALSGGMSIASAIVMLIDVSWTQVLSLASHAWFTPALIVAVWLAATTAFVWAWQRIGWYMTSYVGEPPQA